MPSSRPDYLSFIQWLNIPTHSDDRIAMLARSGGQRETDTLTVFPCPTPDEEGQYHFHFFSHGLRHLPHCGIERINQFEPGEKLWLTHEFQDSFDSKALTLNTEDRLIVGYCPRYLNSEILDLIRKNPRMVSVRVERVNKPPTPLQFRLLCNLTATWGDDGSPFSSLQYQPLIADVAIASS